MATMDDIGKSLRGAGHRRLPIFTYEDGIQERWLAERDFQPSCRHDGRSPIEVKLYDQEHLGEKHRRSATVSICGEMPENVWCDLQMHLSGWDELTEEELLDLERRLIAAWQVVCGDPG